MKKIFLLLALALLAGCTKEPAVDTPAPGPEWEDQEVEWSTQEERDAWFDEQTALAEEFLEEHRELLNGIAAAILETEVAGQFSEFSICSVYSDDNTPYLDSFRRTSDEYRHSQGCDPITPELTLAGLSEGLDRLMTELCALCPLGLTYQNNEYGRSLEISFASTEFPTAILCDVFLCCDITQKNPDGYIWEVKQDEHCMYGL